MSHNLDVDTVEKLAKEMKEEWEYVFRHWPLGVTPIFVTYEALFGETGLNPDAVSQILEGIGLSPLYDRATMRSFSAKQNPGSNEEKVANWHEFPESLRSLRLDIEEMYKKSLEEHYGLRPDLLHLLPDREPAPTQDGWKIRVGSPFLPTTSKENVRDALGDLTIVLCSPLEPISNMFTTPLQTRVWCLQLHLLSASCRTSCADCLVFPQHNPAAMASLPWSWHCKQPASGVVTM